MLTREPGPFFGTFANHHRSPFQLTASHPKKAFSEKPKKDMAGGMVMKSKKSVQKYAVLKGKKVEISPLTGKPKIVRQDRGREEAAAAAKMSKETWLKYQTEEYKKAWPKPAYMNEPREMVYVRDGGDGAYRQATYEIVTRWTSKTRIEYRPHAKAPGSKSHIRYEKYAKAKTVGEALNLGSYPIDWCFDYEHGFIRVLGGEIRDEPIDISKVADPENMDIVDKKIYKWFRRELCRRCGLKPDDLKMEAAWNETLWQRAHRLLANRYAQEILDQAAKSRKPIHQDQVLKVMKAWAFGRNFGRTNVMPDGKEWVWSDTVGLLRDRTGDIHVTGASKRYPAVVQMLNGWLRCILPAEILSFPWTSINLNCNYAARRHRDGNNFGASLIAALGGFTGGGLAVWPEDDKSVHLNKLPKGKEIEIDISQNLAMFNGNSAHEVKSFDGERFSIVFFCVGCHAKAPSAVKDELVELGFQVPPVTEKADRLLRRPQGYGSKKEADKKSLRIWSLKTLHKQAKAYKKDVKKVLKPMKK